jgi:hypothetical protein
MVVGGRCPFSIGERVIVWVTVVIARTGIGTVTFPFVGWRIEITSSDVVRDSRHGERQTDPVTGQHRYGMRLRSRRSTRI